MYLTPATRISVGLVALTISLLLLGKTIGLAPDREKLVLESRKELSEAMAVQFSAAAQKGDLAQIRVMLSELVRRDNDITSAAMRQANGKIVAVAGNHPVHWKPKEKGKSTPTHVQVPVFKGREQWGIVEMSFTPLWIDNIAVGFTNSYLGLIIFIACAGFASYFLLIKWSLRELDPSEVIPDRVRAAFDVLEEGVLILDNKEQIVLANQSFAELAGKSAEELIGFKGSELGWKGVKSKNDRDRLPWMKVLAGKRNQLGIRLEMERGKHPVVTFIVNAAPVLDGQGTHRGVLVTFDNVTELEQRNLELNQAVNKLQLTTEEVQSKNRELEFLANHDPLSKLLNRRAFTRQFNRVFGEIKSREGEMSCVMCDIDHFKSVNDRYGHAAGDKVIQVVAGLLSKHFRQDDIIGRYGGEEFCVVLPGIGLRNAEDIADRVRKAIKEDSSSGVQVTMSFGVSFFELNCHDPEELVSRADKALYIAKESGRNRVVCWGGDDMKDFVSEGKKTSDGSKEACLEKIAPKMEKPQNSESPEVHDEVEKLTIRLHEIEKLAEVRAKELEYFSAYDQQTNLPARTIFNDRATLALARGRRYDNIVAILALSVNSVQRVNETLGHDMGDLLLQGIARRLTTTLRDTDSIAKLPPNAQEPTVSRMSLDEFGILLTDLDDVNAITWIVQRILKAFEEPFQIGNDEVQTNANIGVSIYPHDGETAEVLEQNAAAAKTYARKYHGVNSYYYYSKNIHTVSVKHLKIENQLHRAIKNKEFILHYQPKLEIATGTINGLEALVRWNNPESGLVLPNEFIPVAEYSGLIGPIGEWVLKEACIQVRTWLDMGFDNCAVAVNFSTNQLRNVKLAGQVREILSGCKVDPENLIVEVTESAMMESVDASLKILRELREMGVSIALDDFGTGYSSLVFLKNFPVSHIKIDRSFIADIDTNEKDATLVKSIINMAHGMGLKVTAEGVENLQQAGKLQAFGCDELQGYLLSKPIGQEEATALLKEGAPYLQETTESVALH